MQRQDEVILGNEHCGCADLGAVESLAAGGSKQGAAAEVVIKSMVHVAAQPNPSKGALVQGAALACASLAYIIHALRLRLAIAFGLQLVLSRHLAVFLNQIYTLIE